MAGCVLALGPLVPLAHAAQAQATPDQQEYELKAAFLYRIMQFAEWPALEEEEMRLCVVGSPVVRQAIEIVAGEDVQGRPIRVEAAADVSACHLVFVSRDAAARAEGVLGQVGTAPVLTVGETEAFLEDGGMIRFITDRNRLRLEVNRSVVTGSGLRLSSQLLKLARIR